MIREGFRFALACSLLCSWTAAQATQIVDLDASQAGVGNPVQVNLAAGHWTVTPVGPSGGGAFTAWHPWAGANVGCDGAGEGCSQGWTGMFRVQSPSLGTLAGGGGTGSTPFYQTPGAALANSTSLQFTLASGESVGLYVPDQSISNNLGGVSLRIEFTAPPLGGWVSAPAAGQAARGASPKLPAHPDPSIGSSVFIRDQHSGGNANEVLIRGLAWGRLVDVVDSSGQVQLRDFLIGEGIRDGTVFLPSFGSPVTYGLAQNPVTQQFVLTIPAALKSPRFYEALLNLEAGLTPINDKSLNPNETGPFSMVPRNAAIVVQLDDLLEPLYQSGSWDAGHNGAVVNPNTGQLNLDLVRLVTGYPPATPFEARVFCDVNHGAALDLNGDGTLEFYPTRVIIDPAISPLESQASNPPLGVNAGGFPGSITTDAPNLALRIPTLVNPAVGQNQILRNASGRPLSFTGNGSTNNDTGTLDVVRAMRSGGSEVGDPHNGYLFDDVAPSVLGVLAMTVVGQPFIRNPLRPERFTLPGLRFENIVCSAPIKLGDVIDQAGVLGIVVNPGSPISGANVVVDVVAPAGGSYVAGSAELQTFFDPAQDVPKCFVRYSPAPGLAPNEGVSPQATVSIRFSEPMDAQTLTAFDGFNITRVASNVTGFDYAIGRVEPDPNASTFRWAHPSVPFHHLAGAQEIYFVNLKAGQNGPRDLSGNPLLAGWPQVEFKLDPAAPEGKNAGFALRFANIADDLFDDGKPELRAGQLLYDPVNERILPRPVNRFSSAADTNQPLPAVMTPFVGGIQTPLSNLGSKLHALWRYVDVGFSLTDETNYNIDVEGLSWAPAGGFIVADAFNEFSISLAHSQYLPDEILNPNSGFPTYPASGLKQNFATNLNDPLNDPGTIVHERSLGYVVNPSNLYTATSGTTMLPFPLNENKPVADYSFYTWRDTALTDLGGPSGAGAILAQENAVVFGNTATPGVPYLTNNVPTVGLPLLMEFRCYPSSQALGLNALNISLAANSSARPNFRAFSTGGFDGTQLLFVDPDNNPVAQGGWNPNTNNPTPGTDNAFYRGEMALVTRISRVHSIWFDTGSGVTTYAQPVLEPGMADLPAGTSVTLAFRGADSVTSTALLTDATSIDPYGDQLGSGNDVVFFGGDETWKDDITQLNAARYFQVRISFVSNADTERTADLSTLAFAYIKG